MKTKLITFVLLFCAALSAQVSPWKNGGQDQHQRQTVNSNNTVSNSHNNTAEAGGGSSSNVYNSITPRQTPMGYAPEAIPTAPCRIGRSAGGSSPYFGVALGGSSDDKECEKRVAAAAFADIGNPTAAAKILCTLKAAKDAGLTTEDCMVFVQVATPAPAPIPEAPELPQIIVPAPAVTINPVIQMPPVAAVPVIKKSVHKRASKPCPTLEK